MVDPTADQDIIAVVHRRLASAITRTMDRSERRASGCPRSTRRGHVLKDPRSGPRYDAELANRRDRRSSDRYVRGARRDAAEPGAPPCHRRAPGRPPGARSARPVPAPGHRPGHRARLRSLQGLDAGPGRAPGPGLPGVAPASPSGRLYRAEIATLPQPRAARPAAAVSRRRDPGAWRCSRACPGRARC